MTAEFTATFRRFDGSDIVTLSGTVEVIKDLFELTEGAVSMRWHTAPGPMYRSSSEGEVLISEMRDEHLAAAALKVYRDRIAPRAHQRRFGNSSIAALNAVLSGSFGLDAAEAEVFDQEFKDLVTEFCKPSRGLFSVGF